METQCSEMTMPKHCKNVTKSFPKLYQETHLRSKVPVGSTPSRPTGRAMGPVQTPRGARKGRTWDPEPVFGNRSAHQGPSSPWYLRDRRGPVDKFTIFWSPWKVPNVYKVLQGCRKSWFLPCTSETSQNWLARGSRPEPGGLPEGPGLNAKGRAP